MTPVAEHRQLYMVLSPHSLSYARAALESLFRNSADAIDLHLVTDGKSIYLEDQQDRIIDIIKNAKQPMFLVCVSDQVRRLDDSPRKPVKAEAASAGSRRSTRSA